MTLIKTHELKPGQGSQQIYNALDCCLTYEIFESIVTLANPLPTTYNFTRALQAPALEMMLRGFRVDELERRRGIAELLETIIKLDGVLQQFAQAVWDKPLNPRSPKQLLDFFYKAMCLPEQWTSFKGERKLSTNRETLEKLQVYFHAKPIISTILAIRDYGKQLSVLETDVDKDGRIRTSYNIAGTETGRWSSSAGVTGSGCVLPNAEALTLEGWKRIDLIQDGDVIAQYDRGKIEFVPCKMFCKEYNGKILTVKTEQIKLSVTEEHRVLHFGYDGLRKLIEPAHLVSERSQVRLPLGGRIQGGTRTYPPYLAMLMADFSFEGSGWRGSFKKTRKIERFLNLAKLWGIDYNEQNTNREGYRRFYIPGKGNLPKKYGPWILDLTIDAAKILLEESRHWDAHDRKSGFIFFTADKYQAEWYATLAHIAGKSATIRREEQNPGSYSDTVMWWVNVKNRAYGQVLKKHWSKEDYTGKVYCPQVESSFWLVRQDDFISITGNTNLQNISPKLRAIFVADDGWKLCGIDLEQAESREVGWLCGTLFDDWKYLDAAESGDLHTTCAKLIWPHLPWTGDAKSDRKIADQSFYRDFSYRDMSKRGGHATNYLGTPFTVARHLKVPQKLIVSFQEAYFSAFPAIPKWHQWTAQQLQTTQQLTTPFGRNRHFFGRPNDDTTLREAIAYIPQSATGDRLNLGLYRIWRDLPVRLTAQVHDAVYFQYRPEDEATVVPAALALIHVPMTHGTRTFTIPGEAKIGWNWGNHHDPSKPTSARNKFNPNGLLKFNPLKPDLRTRLSGLSRA